MIKLYYLWIRSFIKNRIFNLITQFEFHSFHRNYFLNGYILHFLSPRIVHHFCSLIIHIAYSRAWIFTKRTNTAMTKSTYSSRYSARLYGCIVVWMQHTWVLRSSQQLLQHCNSFITVSTRFNWLRGDECVEVANLPFLMNQWWFQRCLNEMQVEFFVWSFWMRRKKKDFHSFFCIWSKNVFNLIMKIFLIFAFLIQWNEMQWFIDWISDSIESSQKYQKRTFVDGSSEFRLSD